METMDLLDYELEDNSSSYGGTAFVGETVKDFLDEFGLPYTLPLEELNGALEECGIKKIL